MLALNLTDRLPLSAIRGDQRGGSFDQGCRLGVCRSVPPEVGDSALPPRSTFLELRSPGKIVENGQTVKLNIVKPAAPQATFSRIHGWFATASQGCFHVRSGTLMAFVISPAGTDGDQVDHSGFIFRVDGHERENTGADIQGRGG